MKSRIHPSKKGKKKKANIYRVIFIALKGLGIQMHKLIFVKSERSH